MGNHCCYLFCGNQSLSFTFENNEVKDYSGNNLFSYYWKYHYRVKDGKLYFASQDLYYPDDKETLQRQILKLVNPVKGKLIIDTPFYINIHHLNGKTDTDIEQIISDVFNDLLRKEMCIKNIDLT